MNLLLDEHNYKALRFLFLDYSIISCCSIEFIYFLVFCI